MKFRAVVAAAVAFGGLAVPAAVLAPPPALAVGGFTICEVNGKYCFGSSDLSLGTAVTERTPGRNFMLVPIGRGVDNLPTYEIASSTAANSCVAAGFGGEIVYHSCSNGDQVVWEMVISSKGNTEWLDNALASSGPQTRWFLGGNNNGTQFRLSQEGDGGFIQFNK